MTGPAVLPPPIIQEPPVPLAAIKVTDLLTSLVSTLTSIPPQLVRPRWQRTPPQQPPVHVDWASVGIINRAAQGYTSQAMSFLPGTTTEALLVRRWAALEALVSFYGPHSEDLAELFRESCYIVQNLAGLYAYGIKLTGVEEVVAVPDLVNLQWIDHQDVHFNLVREFDRYFPMQSLLTGVGTAYADDAGSYPESIDSNQAAPVTPPRLP